jgi:hypothetical protein
MMNEKIRVAISRLTQKRFDDKVRDPNTLYFTTDTHRLYFGNLLVGQGEIQFSNTGSGWRAHFDDGTVFQHNDDDLIIQEDDRYLTVASDNLDQINNDSFSLDLVWKSVFSPISKDLQYGPNYRFYADLTESEHRVYVTLQIRTDDPVTKFEKHYEYVLLDGIKGGKHEIPLSKYDLEGKDWNIVATTRMGIDRVKRFAWIWGTAGGFKATVDLRVDSDSNAIQLWGKDNQLASQDFLKIGHDDNLIGDGNKASPLKWNGVQHDNSLIGSGKIGDQLTVDYSWLGTEGEVVTDWAAYKTESGFTLEKTRSNVETKESTTTTYPFVTPDFRVENIDDKFIITIPWRLDEVHHLGHLIGNGTAADPLDAMIYSHGGERLVEDVVGAVGTEAELILPNGEFTFKREGNLGIIMFKEDGAEFSTMIGNVNLSNAVDGYTTTWEFGKIVAKTHLKWDGEDFDLHAKKTITQVEYDDLITTDRVDQSTIYYTTDTLRIYVGELLYSKDYTEGGELPITYDSEWTPSYKSWRPDVYYPIQYRVEYAGHSYVCLVGHVSGVDFNPEYWEECDPPVGAKVRRNINEGPNDFQIAFLRYADDYSLNDHWLTEHTFNFRIVPDPENPSNQRGRAEFAVDGNVITWQKGDFVLTNADPQTVDGVKTFIGDPRVPEPKTINSAVPKGYSDDQDAKILEEFKEAIKKYEDYAKNVKDDLEFSLIDKADVYYPHFTEKDIGELVYDEWVRTIKFVPNPSVGLVSFIELSPRYSFHSNEWRLWVRIDDREHELFNDATETWIESFNDSGVEWRKDLRELTFHRDVEVSKISDNWQEAWGNKAATVVTCLRDLVIDPRYNFENGVINDQLLKVVTDLQVDLEDDKKATITMGSYLPKTREFKSQSYTVEAGRGLKIVETDTGCRIDFAGKRLPRFPIDDGFYAVCLYSRWRHCDYFDIKADWIPLTDYLDFKKIITVMKPEDLGFEIAFGGVELDNSKIPIPDETNDYTLGLRVDNNEVTLIWLSNAFDQPEDSGIPAPGLIPFPRGRGLHALGVTVNEETKTNYYQWQYVIEGLKNE